MQLHSGIALLPCRLTGHQTDLEQPTPTKSHQAADAAHQSKSEADSLEHGHDAGLPEGTGAFQRLQTEQQDLRRQMQAAATVQAKNLLLQQKLQAAEADIHIKKESFQQRLQTTEAKFNAEREAFEQQLHKAQADFASERQSLQQQLQTAEVKAASDLQELRNKVKYVLGGQTS